MNLLRSASGHFHQAFVGWENLFDLVIVIDVIIEFGTFHFKWYRILVEMKEQQTKNAEN